MKPIMFDLRNLIYLSALLFAFSCGSSEKGVEYAELKTEMDSIATASQKELLKNVSTAFRKGGTVYAVGFCNIMAIPITDSLSEAHRVLISRITDRTRNPENGLTTENDKAVFGSFRENKDLVDSLLTENSKIVYYKRINTSMPTCIKCHGNPEKDIEPATLAKIKTLYPNDQATGYSMNEFRGLWRIEKDKK